MHKNIFSTVLAVLSAAFLFGCATPQYNPEPFNPAPLDADAYIPAVDAFVVVLDSSSSMNEKHGGRSKYYVARDVVNNMNQTIPPLDYQAGLVIFGSGRCLDYGTAELVYGLSPYSESALASSVNSLECASGNTPMPDGVDVGTGTLDPVSGKTALIIVSDFKEAGYTSMVNFIEGMNADYGDELCIHSIQVGDNRRGRHLMKDMAEISDCGSAVNAEDIASADAMAGYVADTLLEPAPVLDSDGDGVPDDIDQCPGTPPGVRVNAVGCWVLAEDNVLFEVDRTEIRDTTMLDEAIEILIANPEITGEIQGHTDSTGPAEYNMGLSLRRAEAVFDYMVQEGVAAERMRVEGYGEERPIASNDTAEGRAQNRRVELHPDR